MKAYQIARRKFEVLEPGTAITTSQLAKMAGLPVDDLKVLRNVSSFLCRACKLGTAERGGKRDAAQIYVKVKVDAQPKKPKIEEVELDYLKLGKGIYSIIKQMEARIKELKGELAERNTTIGTLIEEKKSLEAAYKQAQARIIELNGELDNGDKRPVKLNDLRALTM